MNFRTLFWFNEYVVLKIVIIVFITLLETDQLSKSPTNSFMLKKINMNSHVYYAYECTEQNTKKCELNVLILVK